MKIALIGYGKMGHAVEKHAAAHGHRVVLTLDKGEEWPERIEADVAIEFSTPATAADNVRRCIERGVAVVCGTTGWYDRYEEVSALCREKGGRLLTATNFSIGMNIMFALNKRLAELMRGRADYAVDIDETHHIHKLDAPSGTALTLREQVVDCGGREPSEVAISSHRIGEVPGTHTVRYRSAIDTIILTHEAHSRDGLALGALMAAEWLTQASAGVYGMEEVVGGIKV